MKDGGKGGSKISTSSVQPAVLNEVPKGTTSSSLFHPSSLAAQGTGLIQPPHGTSFDGAKKSENQSIKTKHCLVLSCQQQ